MMSFQKIVGTLIALVTLLDLHYALKSPCPRIFVFEPRKSQDDKWFGIIKVRSRRELRTLNLELLFDKSVITLGVTRNKIVGEIKSENNNRKFWIRKGEVTIKADEDYTVEIFVVYDPYYDDPPPNIRRIRLNGREICPNYEEEKITVNTVVVNDDLCGRVFISPTPLITNGKVSKEGRYPWHVAINQDNNGEMKYACGGSLISRKHVLTAAHCTTQGSNPMRPNQLEVVLGKYGMFFTSAAEKKMNIVKVIVHPRFNHTHYFNDISILVMSNAITYTTHIRSVCLWSGDTSFSSIGSRPGTALGWGRDENGNEVTDLLMEVPMPIVETSECHKKKFEFYPFFLDGNNFCAGYANGSSVCNGDSGGGLVFKKEGTNWPDEIWEIRGIVSSTIAQEGQICDPFYYVIFTDVGKFVDWIRANTKIR